MARVNTLRHYIKYLCHGTTVFAEDQPQLRILWILLTKKAVATQNPVSQSLRRAVLDGNALFRPTVKKKEEEERQRLHCFGFLRGELS